VCVDRAARACVCRQSQAVGVQIEFCVQDDDDGGGEHT